MRAVSKVGRIAMILCVLVTGLSSSASAAPLGLSPNFPDITAGFIMTAYNASTGDFSAVGSPASLFPTSNPADEIPIGGTNPNYTIAGSFNNLTGAISGPSYLNILGNIAGGASDNVLLGGVIKNFGFNGPTVAQSSVLEFVIAVSGGLPAFGPYAGVILSQVKFGAANSDGISISYRGISDNFAEVPEPGTLALLGFGLSAAAARRRKKQL